MATSKKTKIDGYFFMSICNGELDVNCSGDKNIISAAFATLFVDKSNKQLQGILGTAVAVAAHELQSEKEKYSSKKKNNPKQMDGTKSDEPFVKTRKKKNKQ
jgi:hypothetical protein